MNKAAMKIVISFFVVVGQMHSFLFHVYLREECLGYRVGISLAVVDTFVGHYSTSFRFSFKTFLLAAGTGASCQPSLEIAAAEECFSFSSYLWPRPGDPLRPDNKGEKKPKFSS